MANQDYNIKGSQVVQARDGQNDILPITGSPHWFRLNGIIGLSHKLERISGKRLSFGLRPRSILSIHSNNQGQVFVQTDQNLLLFQEYELLTDQVIADEDGSVVITDLGQ